MTLSLLIGWLFVADITAARAQTAPSVAKLDTPANIQAAIVKTIGAEEKTVEVTHSGNILVVARVNSNMNASTHAGRNNEAKVIGSLVEKRIADEPEFKKVVTIRVEYLVRSAPTAKSKVVDIVEFRKGPDGVFDFHQT
jgi:hypothetical protein